MDLGFGPNSVDIDAFEPKWLVSAANATLQEPNADNLEEWKQAYWFAAVTGLQSESVQIALKIVPVDAEFKEAGTRFRYITF